MQGGHLIALRHKVRKTGDKYNLHLVILLPQLLCKGNSIHPLHLNIQQQNIIILMLRIMKQKALRRDKSIYVQDIPSLCRPAPGHILNIILVCCGIVANRDFIIHVPALPGTFFSNDLYINF